MRLMPLMDSFLTPRFRRIIILSFLLALPFLPQSAQAALPTYDECHSFFGGWDADCLMTKTRSYFNITSNQVPDAILLAYITDHKEAIATYLMKIDDGRNVLSFLSGGALNVYGDTLSAEFNIYMEVGALAWGEIAGYVLDFMDGWGSLYGLIGSITGGIEALQNAVMVLSTKETRFLLGVYCQDRYNGMTESEAWADITIPEFQPLWDLINNLQSVSLDARQWNYEWAYQSYRLVGYGDSYDLRTDIGNGIVALCYPTIIGQNTVGILQSVTLYGGGSIGGSAPSSWEWDFEYDGNPDNFEVQAAGEQVSHTYRTTGTKTVGLRATADGFAPVIVTRSIWVVPPRIEVSYPNGYEDMERHFSTPDLPGVDEYTWSYGDGTPSEKGRTKDHTYVNTGYYTVGLTLTLDDDSTIQSQTGIFVGPGTRYIQGHTIYGDETWYTGGTYVVQGSITVAQGGRLTIEPGATIKVDNGGYFSVTGTLTATSASFTWADEVNEWDGIVFNNGSSGSKLDGCTIEHANGIWQSVRESIAIRDGASPTITGCTIKNSSAYHGIVIQGSPVISNNTISGFVNYGLFVSGFHDNISSPIVTGNTINGNGTGILLNNGGGSGTYQDNTLSDNEFGVYAYYGTNNPIITGNTYSNNSMADLYVNGIINTAVTLGDGGDIILQVGSLQIAEDASLTIEPGATIKVDNGGYFSVTGTLTATSASFTWADEVNEWDGIVFNNGSSGSKLDGCTIEHANGIWQSVRESIAIRDGASPTITGCTIKNSTANHGILVQEGTPVITNNTISGFSAYGIFVSSNSSPMLTGNTITNNQYGINISGGASGNYQGNTISSNTSYGLYYTGTAVIDATNCNWGHPTGPLDDSDDRANGGWYNPGGLGDKVSNHVNYTPWTGGSVPIPGDINHDGVVDLADAVLGLQIMAGTVPDQMVFQDADVNQDDRIGIEEVIYIFQKVAGQR